jgi:hypothetical protein
MININVPFPEKLNFTGKNSFGTFTAPKMEINTNFKGL